MNHQTKLVILALVLRLSTLSLASAQSVPLPAKRALAAAVGTPTIALFGPTNPERHRPYGKGHYVIEKAVSCRPCYKRTCLRVDAPHLCMTEIQAADVVERIATHFNLPDYP